MRTINEQVYIFFINNMKLNMIVARMKISKNYGYIGTSILRIYRRYIGGYSEKKISIDLKLLKTHGNARKTS